MPSRAAEQQRQFVQYHVRVLAMNPIAYWPSDEKSGTVAYGWAARPAGTQNGSYVGVDLGYPGIGDGRTSPFYDGVNDFLNVQTAALAAAFNGSEGSMALWLKVSAIGDWADGTVREPYRFLVDGNNYVIMQKQVGGGLTFLYNAGGVSEAFTKPNPNTTEWIHLVHTWSKSADIVRGYYNAGLVNQSGTLGNWAGNLATSLISSNAGGGYWKGYIAHFAIWTRALSVYEITDLYRTRWS